MNKFIFFTLFIFVFIYFNNLVSNENSPIDIKWVAYNCNSCHLPNAKTDNIIPSFSSINKKEFIIKMNNYKKIDDNSIMSRLVKVLSKEDFIRLADYYYDK